MCGAFFLCALIAACSSGVTSRPRNVSSQLVVGVPESTASGPQVGAAQFVDNLTLEGLTNLTIDGRAAPRLAESWRWEKNGLALRLNLRRGILFHDGSRFDGTAAAQALREAVARGSNRAFYPALNDIVGIHPDGDLQVVVDVSRPSALLPEELTVPLWKGKEKVGTGAYRLESPNGLSLHAFDRYYQGKPAIERLVVRPSITLRTAWTSLLRGEVDAVGDVPPDAVEFIRNNEVNVISFPRWYQFLIAFNSQAPMFRSPAVRRALNLAIDRQRLVTRVLKGRGSASTGPLWPKYWAYDSSAVQYGYDPQLAGSLLDANGYAMPHGATPDQARLKFTCLIPANFVIWERIALEVQKDLYAIGVDMQFKVVPLDEFGTLVASGRFDAAFADMISGPSLARSYLFWRSSKQLKGVNTFGYENAEAEQLFDLLRSSSSEAVVRSVTRRMQRIFLDDPPAIFLAWNERARAVRRDFTVVQEPGRDPMVTFWKWHPARPLLSASVQ